MPRITLLSQVAWLLVAVDKFYIVYRIITLFILNIQGSTVHRVTDISFQHLPFNTVTPTHTNTSKLNRLARNVVIIM